MSNKVFISYRRADTAGYAGRIYDRLSQYFGANNIFMDVDSIAPGEDFVQALDRAVSQVDVLIALIGVQWVSITDSQNRRRLDDPNDFVRLEIQTALERDIRVIPVLVGGAYMPGPGDLPEGLEALSRRNALSVRHERFKSDTDELIAAIESLIVPGPTKGEQPVAVAQTTQTKTTPKQPKFKPIWAYLLVGLVFVILAGIWIISSSINSQEPPPIAQVESPKTNLSAPTTDIETVTLDETNQSDATDTILDDFSSNSLQWDEYQNAHISFRIQDGAFRFAFKEEDYGDGLAVPVDFTANKIEFDYWVGKNGYPDTSTGIISVMCQKSSSGYNAIDIYPEDQGVMMIQVSGSEANPYYEYLTPENDEGWYTIVNPALKTQPLQVNHVEITCFSKHMAISINDTLIYQTDIEPLPNTNGRTDLYLISPLYMTNAEYEVFIDNFYAANVQE